MKYGMVKIEEDGVEHTFLLPEPAYTAIVRDIKANSVGVPVAETKPEPRRVAGRRK